MFVFYAPACCTKVNVLQKYRNKKSLMVLHLFFQNTSCYCANDSHHFAIMYAGFLLIKPQTAI